MTEILRTHNLAHAHSLQTALEGAGIEAQVHGDQAGYAADVGVSVVVTNPVDAAKAYAILKQMEQSKHR